MEKTTIDMTPTWSALLPAMLDVIANPNAKFESKKIIREELARMALIADKCIELNKEKLAKEKLAKE